MYKHICIWALYLMLHLSPEAREVAAEESTTCSTAERIMVSTRRPFSGPPPTEMPSDLVSAYTRCGTIPIGSPGFYVDDTSGGKGTHYRYSQKEIEKFIASAKQLLALPTPGKMMGKRGWVTETIGKYKETLQGTRCVVFGSMTPTVETLLLAAGVAHVTVVEYNNLTYTHPQIRTVRHDVLDAEIEREGEESKFDVAVSISSFDHDGLGRYGDPLCPDGDLLSNDLVKTRYLKKKKQKNTEGIILPLYFLTLPIGPDVVVWNLHRRYGPIRLPFMLHGWETVDRIGWSEALLTTAVSYTLTTEPVFVLTPSSDDDENTKADADDDHVGKAPIEGNTEAVVSTAAAGEL